MSRLHLTKYQKKNILIGALLGVVVLIGIAYAAFASDLNIVGTGNTTNNWDVRITNIRGVNECLSNFDNQSATSKVENKVEYIPNAKDSSEVQQMGSSSCFRNDASDITPPTKSVDGLSATFNAGLVQPGDTRIYEVEVTNSGSLDAVVSHTLTNNSNNPAIEITYDGYSTTSVLTEGGKYSSTSLQTIEPFDLLKNGDKKYIYITVKYSDSVTSQPNNLTAQVTITLNATQKESSSSVGPNTGGSSSSVGPNTGGSSEQEASFTGTIYRNNTNILLNGLTYNGSATVWYPPEWYSTAQEAFDDYYAYSSQADCENNSGETCTSGTVTITPGSYEIQASNLNKTYYLKHTITNDIVTASYACFVSDTEHCMQGGNSSYYSANRTLLESQETWFNNHLGSCSFGSDISYCRGGGFFNVGANSSGIVSASVSGDGGCGVGGNGNSDCSVS